MKVAEVLREATASGAKLLKIIEDGAYYVIQRNNMDILLSQLHVLTTSHYDLHVKAYREGNQIILKVTLEGQALEHLDPDKDPHGAMDAVAARYDFHSTAPESAFRLHLLKRQQDIIDSDLDEDIEERFFLSISEFEQYFDCESAYIDQMLRDVNDKYRA